MNRLKTLAMGAVAVVGTLTIGAGVTMAAPNITEKDPMNGLVSAIATKFHLNATDVQAVFDEQRAVQHKEMQVKRAEMESARLSAAVTAGKITAEQKALIIARQAENEVFMKSLVGKTPAERQALMKTQAEAMKTWAATNSIPAQYVHGFGPGLGHVIGKRGGPGFGKGIGARGSAQLKHR